MMTTSKELKDVELKMVAGGSIITEPSQDTDRNESMYQIGDEVDVEETFGRSHHGTIMEKKYENGRWYYHVSTNIYTVWCDAFDFVYTLDNYQIIM